MTKSEAIHIARNDTHFQARVAYFLATAARNIAAEAAGTRQARAVEIANNLPGWTPRFGEQLVSMVVEATLTGFTSEGQIPVNTSLIASAFDAFLQK